MSMQSTYYLGQIGIIETQYDSDIEDQLRDNGFETICGECLDESKIFVDLNTIALVDEEDSFVEIPEPNEQVELFKKVCSTMFDENVKVLVKTGVICTFS